MGGGGWGIGDWGLGIGPNPQSPIPNPQSPIPNPQLKIHLFLNIIFSKKKLNLKKSKYYLLIYLSYIFLQNKVNIIIH